MNSGIVLITKAAVVLVLNRMTYSNVIPPVRKEKLP